MESEEVWKPVPYAPFDKAYSVSNLGRVKPNSPSRYSKNKADVLRPAASKRGYLFVTLYAEGKRREAFVHRMVALVFHGAPPDGKPYVLHRDDCQTNNRADNLYWGNERANWHDRQRNGLDQRGERNGRAVLSAATIERIRGEYAAGGISQQALADRHGVHQTQISRIVRRAQWR